MELPDPNAVTGSRDALAQLAATARLKLAEVRRVVDRRLARLTAAAFDLQLRYFAGDMALTAQQRTEWRERFLSLAADVATEEQQILIAHLTT